MDKAENNDGKQQRRPTALVSALKLTELFKPLTESESFGVPIRYSVEDRKLFVFVSPHFKEIGGKSVVDRNHKFNLDQNVLDYITFSYAHRDENIFRDLKDSVNDNSEVECNLDEPDGITLCYEAVPISEEDMLRCESAFL